MIAKLRRITITAECPVCKSDILFEFLRKKSIVKRCSECAWPVQIDVAFSPWTATDDEDLKVVKAARALWKEGRKLNITKITRRPATTTRKPASRAL